MKVAITEDYPGELRQKADELVARVAQMCGGNTGCSCGHCDSVEKAVGIDKMGDTPYKGEETPFQFIKDVRKRAHDLGERTQSNIVTNVLQYLEQRQQ